MENELSPELRDYLEYCGLSRKRIAGCIGDTRMYHDLGLYGDIAESYMEVLASRYHVDLSAFEFERFFPPEFEGNGALSRLYFHVVPFASHRARKRQRDQYLPLTLEMIDRAIRSKRWE